ncbi:MAG: prephenate dehydratase [Micrococcales bacterium]|nr:MAG: prephenate dehydratase [Micrococcales bacterium]
MISVDGPLGYLGPAATFTETALLAVPGARQRERRPYPTVDAALDAVRRGEVAAAMVPLENSVEGGVSATMDAMSAGSQLRVRREVVVPVNFVLAARAGTALADVRRISTHAHAWAQCRKWVAANLPDAQHVPGLSTAASAAALAAEQDVGYDAAMCAQLAAATYGLDVLAHDVADNPYAQTRFVLVAGPHVPPPAPTGADKTSLVLFQRDDYAGGLSDLLGQFAGRGINLTWIQSRPIPTMFGRYSFAIDCEGHIEDARVADAIRGVYRLCSQVRFLGSYPRADGVPNHVRNGMSDADFAAAEDWLQALLDHS